MKGKDGSSEMAILRFAVVSMSLGVVLEDLSRPGIEIMEKTVAQPVLERLDNHLYCSNILWHLRHCNLSSGVQVPGGGNSTFRDGMWYDHYRHSVTLEHAIVMRKTRLA